MAYFKNKDLNIMDELPLVSVLMTSFNREKHIAEAIESVLGSTYSHFELIVVDDCSTDETVSIIKEFEKKDSRVKMYINEQNLGDYPNRNKAVSYASGKMLMFVDSDDSILPDSIEYIVGAFTSHPEVNFSLLYYHKDITKPTVLKANTSIRQHFFEKGFLNIGPGGTVINHEFFIKIGGFPEKYGPANDMYYNLKAAANTDIILLPYIYLNYRIHDGQEKNNRFKYLCYDFRYLSDAMLLPELTLNANEKKAVRRRSARNNLIAFARYIKSTGEFRKAFKAFKISKIKLKDLL